MDLALAGIRERAEAAMAAPASSADAGVGPGAVVPGALATALQEEHGAYQLCLNQLAHLVGLRCRDHARLLRRCAGHYDRLFARVHRGIGSRATEEQLHEDQLHAALRRARESEERLGEARRGTT